MIKNVIVKKDRVEVITDKGDRLFFSLEMAEQLRKYLNEIL